MKFFSIAIGSIIWHFRKAARILVGSYCNWRYNSRISCGANVNFLGYSRFYGCDKIQIGNNVTVGENAFVKGEGGLTMGDNIHIARNLTLYTHNHNFSGSALPYDNTFIFKPVTIGNNVWIGINVTILPGTVIGEGAIIGAGTVVSGQVEPLAIIGSAKNRTLSYRDKKHYDNCIQEGRFGGINGVPLH